MSAAALGPDTPYWRAVLALFERIGATLPATLPAPVRAILVGGAAVHVHTGARVSRDVEAIFSHRILLPQDLLVRYTDEAGLSRQVVYDYNYFFDLGLMHPDYDRDAVALGQLPGYPLVLAVLAPVDLAVSKLARFQDQDRSDLASLARRGLLHGLPFQQRVGEALSYYVGDSRWLRYNLRDALALIDANTPAPVPRRGPAPGSFRP